MGGWLSMMEEDRERALRTAEGSMRDVTREAECITVAREGRWISISEIRTPSTTGG